MLKELATQSGQIVYKEENKYRNSPNWLEIKVRRRRTKPISHCLQRHYLFIDCFPTTGTKAHCLHLSDSQHYSLSSWVFILC